jgi:1-acyl-sn-glycerol-3-phosphate acyltransferase
MSDKKDYFQQLYKHIPLNRLIGNFLGYSFYFGTSVFLILFIIVFIVPFSFSLTIRKKGIQFIYTKFVYHLTRSVLPALQVYKYKEISGFDNLPLNTPIMYVANHRSQMDGPVVLSELPNPGVIMKSTYAKSPVYALLVKYLDFISVDSNSFELIASAMQRCHSVIKEGKSLLIFPEGTRARSARMLQFKDLAFRLAIESNIPVVPIIIHFDFPFMAKIPRSFYPPVTLNLTLRALPPMYAEKNERPSEFADRVRLLMIKETKTLDKDTYWEYLN